MKEAEDQESVVERIVCERTMQTVARNGVYIQPGKRGQHVFEWRFVNGKLRRRYMTRAQVKEDWHKYSRIHILYNPFRKEFDLCFQFAHPDPVNDNDDAPAMYDDNEHEQAPADNAAMTAVIEADMEEAYNVDAAMAAAHNLEEHLEEHAVNGSGLDDLLMNRYGVRCNNQCDVPELQGAAAQKVAMEWTATRKTLGHSAEETYIPCFREHAKHIVNGKRKKIYTEMHLQN